MLSFCNGRAFNTDILPELELKVQAAYERRIIFTTCKWSENLSIIRIPAEGSVNSCIEYFVETAPVSMFISRIW